MSADLEGVTVLAWGAQVPDCLASLSMAKKGLGPGAVANAVGSQIINVFIGLGLPYAIAGSSPLNTGGASTTSSQPESTATLCPNETHVLACVNHLKPARIYRHSAPTKPVRSRGLSKLRNGLCSAQAWRCTSRA